jgi:3-hydroxybutyryl-CoA dehydrogenase
VAHLPDTIGVVGAGIMGAGIAQLSAQAGARTLLYDAVPEGLERGLHRIESGLARAVERGRLTAEQRDEILARVTPASALAELAPCGMVIEAAPERIELKLEVFAELARHVAPECVLATNTSSLSVTEIAAGTPGPERVVGMHFFNPPPVMKLVEVIAGTGSSTEAMQTARAVGEAMGKTVIDAADVAGFLVNRCARPYSLISLRLLQERIATPAQIDRIARMEGGFRMGPFELQDLVGLDTNHAVAEAFQRQSYGEPRYQPSPLQARMVAAGHLGRKTGRGWYEYGEDPRGSSHRPPDPEPPAPGGGDGRTLAILGDLPVLNEIADAAGGAGFDVVRDPGQREPWLTLGETQPEMAGPKARLLHDTSLHAADPGAAGFHVVAPFATARLVEVTRTPRTDPEALERLTELIVALGRHAEPVGDAPGLVLGRIVAALVNEAAFLIGEGNGTADGVEAGLTLGLNHPRGPVAWSRALGLPHVTGILSALRRELGEERYRIAPLLARAHALGAPGLTDG